MKKEITKQEKLQLLKVFLKEEVYMKAITDTLSEKELDKWLEMNLDTMLLKVGSVENE